VLASTGAFLRKEDKTMTYSKPEVVVLGNASVVIEAMSKLTSGTDSSIPRNTNPAYDLDE
jgi:hypothetical protein